MRIIRTIIPVLAGLLLTLTACTSPFTAPQSPTPTQPAPTSPKTPSSSNQTQTLPSQPAEFTKITAPLTLTDQEPGTHIPYGSVIYHWANGITEVYGADNNRLFIAKDSEAAILPHPSGPSGPFDSPATFILQVPNGARISNGKTDSIMEVYLGETLILTIIKKSEDYPPEIAK